MILRNVAWKKHKALPTKSDSIRWITVYRYDIQYDDFMKATSFDELLTKIYPSSEGSVLSMWYLKNDQLEAGYKGNIYIPIKGYDDRPVQVYPESFTKKEFNFVAILSHVYKLDATFAFKIGIDGYFFDPLSSSSDIDELFFVTWLVVGQEVYCVAYDGNIVPAQSFFLEKNKMWKQHLIKAGY